MSAREWPPVIRSGHAPGWTRARDVLLTVLAWMLLAWWFRGAIALVADYLTHPMFELTMPEPDWDRIWRRLSPYLAVTALFSAWLLFFAAYRGPVLSRQIATEAQPEPLPLGQHAERYGLGAADVEALRELRVATVGVGKDGRIEGVTAPRASA